MFFMTGPAEFQLFCMYRACPNSWTPTVLYDWACWIPAVPYVFRVCPNSWPPAVLYVQGLSKQLTLSCSVCTGPVQAADPQLFCMYRACPNSWPPAVLYVQGLSKQLTTSCSVCGGPAASHLHYGAVCCYSCRAFFRKQINSISINQSPVITQSKLSSFFPSRFHVNLFIMFGLSFLPWNSLFVQFVSTLYS